MPLVDTRPAPEPVCGTALTRRVKRVCKSCVGLGYRDVAWDKCVSVCLIELLSSCTAVME
jgi:hypothetical protein